jgi:hypothetical protein
MLSQNAQSKIFKTLVVEDEENQKIKILSLELPLLDDKISFRELFYEILPDVSLKTIKTYDFAKDSFTNLVPPNYLVPLAILHPTNLIILKINTPCPS